MKYTIPIEAFLKPCLLEWLEVLMDTSPQHPMLCWIRQKGSIGEEERDRLLWWVHKCEYRKLIDLFRTKYWLDYISFLLDVSPEDISQIRISDNVYTRDDLEGAFIALNNTIQRIFVEEYPRPRTIRGKIFKLSEIIRGELVSTVRKFASDPSSQEQKVRQILGQARTDFEELIKYVDCFMSRLGLLDKQYEASLHTTSRENLSTIVSRITTISPHSFGLLETDGAAPRTLISLINCLSEKLEESQVSELRDAHPDFGDKKFLENPYRLHALRIFGNIFHHEGANYRHVELIQKYADVAGDYLYRLAELLPEIVYVESIEQRFSGQKVISIYNTETQQTHRFQFLYTVDREMERYRPLTDKKTLGNAPFNRGVVQAFILPGDLSNQQAIFPFIVEWRVIPLGKPNLHLLVEETCLRVEVVVETPIYATISSEKNVQEQY